MNPTATALRAGARRGVIELRQSSTNGADLWNHAFWPVLMLVVTYFLRDVSFGRTGFTVGALALPGILGMNAAMAMVTMSRLLTAVARTARSCAPRPRRTGCWATWSAGSCTCPAASSWTWRNSWSPACSWYRAW